MYCNNCGKENKKVKKCEHCGKKIKLKNKVFTDYIFDYGKDEITDNIKDTIFDKITFLLKKYLYGVIVSVTVIGSVAANVIVNAKEEVVTEKPEVSFDNVKYSSIDNLIQALLVAVKNKDQKMLDNLFVDYHYPDAQYQPEDTESEGYAYNNKRFYKNVLEGVFSNDDYQVDIGEVKTEVYEGGSCVGDFSYEECVFYDNVEGQIYSNIITFKFKGDNSRKYTVYMDYILKDNYYYLFNYIS